MVVPNPGYRWFWWGAVVALLLLATSRGMTSESAGKTESIRVWDTLSLLVDQVGIRDRSGWVPVPPGTGQDYTPRGDLVVENGYLTAVFSPKSGRVILYSQPSGKSRMELIPPQSEGKSAVTTSCKIVESLKDRTAIDVRFSGAKVSSSVIFSFGNNPYIEVKPNGQMNGLSFICPIEFAVIPSFIGDDLVFDPGSFPSAEALRIPAENTLVGLLSGEDGVLVVTWPERRQEGTTILKRSKGEGSVFESVRFENGGERIHVAVLEGAGIWHREELKSSYLEKDIAINWRRPFPAKWKTQLDEDGVKTTYGFRDSRRKEFWRGGVGTYTYPVWFNGERVFYHLGKKIPPKGQSLVYFLERAQGTPREVSAPADIMKLTLSNEEYVGMFDFEGRKLTSDNRPDPCVGTATCGVTDKFKPIFEAGKEAEKKDYIEGGIEDMIYHLAVLMKRVDHYQEFAREMMAYLAATRKERPELGPLLDELGEVAGELISAYHAEKANIKTLTYAEKLGRRTVALSQERRSDNLAAFLKLKGEWTGMGGSLEGLNRKLHTVARALSQRAGYGCVGQPEAVELAKEIRRRVKKLLRNPNSYEMWAYD